MRFKKKLIAISTIIAVSTISLIIFLPNLQSIVFPIPFNEMDIPFGSLVSANPNCNFGTNPSTGKCNPTYFYPSVECGGGIWGVTGCPKTTTSTPAPAPAPTTNPTPITTTTPSTTSPSVVSYPATTTSNHILPCDFNAFVQVYYTDGTFDTIQSNTAFFYPNVLSLTPATFVLQNPTSGKIVNYFQFQPQLLCNIPSTYASLTHQVSGSYKFYYYGYYSTSSGVFGRTPVFSVTANIPSTNFGTLQSVNLGSVQQIYPSSILSSLPTGVTSVSLVSFVTPTLSFYIPDLQQSSSWTGTVYFSNVAYNLKATGSQTSPYVSQSQVSTPSPSTTGINLQGKIHYKIFYQNGNTQAGDAQDVRTIGVQKLTLFGGAGQPNPSTVTDITYTVLVSDNGLGVNLSNPQLTLGGTVTVGGSQPFQLQSSDFKTTIVNDVNYGLVIVDLPVNTLDSEILNHYGPPPANQQQVSVTLTVNGQFTAQYQGSTYNGQITDLSWTFPTMYGSSSIASTSSSSSAGGASCTQYQGSAGINPYGGSPSSGQSFGCGVTANKNCNFGTNPSDGTCNVSIGFPAVECGGNIWGISGCNTASTSSSSSSGSSVPTGSGGTYGTPSQTCILPNGIANPLGGPNCNNPSSGSPISSPLQNNPSIPPFGSGGTVGFCTDGSTGLACLSQLLGFSQNPALWGIVVAVVAVVIISTIAIKVKRRNTA